MNEYVRQLCLYMCIYLLYVLMNKVTQELENMSVLQRLILIPIALVM